MKVSLINAALRIATLGSRFLLSLYIAKLLSIRDVGLFALLTGLIGLLPALTGFGLNYFVGRAIVRESSLDATRMARDRLLISILVSGIVAIGIAVLARTGLVALPVQPLLLVGIIVLEMASFDAQMMLLARRKSAFANLLLFLRSGGWVLPYIAASYTVPALRTINAVALFWIGGLVASSLLLVVRFRGKLPVATAGIGDTAPELWRILRGGSKIYLADVGLAGSIYLDRFVISGLLNIEAAGIYFFFSSIINAVYTICLASTTQVYAPDFRSAYVDGGLDGLHAAIGGRMRQTIGLTLLMLGLAMPATWAVALLVHKPQLLANVGLIPIIAAAYAVKILSEFMSAVLAAAGQDNQYAAFHIVELILTVGLCALGTLAGGLLGTACGLFAACCLVAGLRFVGWRRLRAGHRAPPLVPCNS